MKNTLTNLSTNLSTSDTIQLFLIIVTLFLGLQSNFKILEWFIKIYKILKNKLNEFYNYLKTRYLIRNKLKKDYQKILKLQKLIKDYPYYKNKFVILFYNDKNKIFFKLSYKTYKKQMNQLYICVDPEDHITYFKSDKANIILRQEVINKLFWYENNDNYSFVCGFQELLINYDVCKSLNRGSKKSLVPDIPEIIF